MTLDPTAPQPPLTDPADDEAPSAEFASALAAHEGAGAPAAPEAERTIEVGAKVSGRVVAIGEEYAMIDHGGRSEATADLRHWRAEDGTLSIAVGDTLELFVLEAGDQVVLGPSVRAEAHAALRQMREAKASGMPVSGRVTGLNTGGLQIDVGGVRGFCPISQIEAGFCADASVYVGRTLEFLVTEVKDGKGGVVLSRRALLRKADEAQAQQTLATLQPGDVRDGKVRRLEPFGAFVDLGGIDGMVHVSEIRHDRVAHPKDALKEGEAVRVKVLRVEPGKDGRPRIALSIKACAPDPWADATRQFTPGARVRGVVARLADFGAFVTLAPGLDGLVHVSQIASERIQHPREALSPGQEVEALVLAVEPDKKRIALSIKAVLEGLSLEQVAAAGGRGERAERGGERGGERGAERGGRGERGGDRGGRGGDRGGRGGDRGGDRGGRVDRRERDDWRAHMQQASAGPAEPTTMALALRKAMEEAERKKAGQKPA